LNRGGDFRPPPISRIFLLTRMFHRLPCIAAITATCLVWLGPFATLGRHVLVGDVAPGPSPVSSGGLMAGPPPWLADGSSASRWPGLLFRSLRLSLGSAAVAIVLGTLLAFLLVRCRWRGSRAVSTFWKLAIFLPLPVFATAWLGAFANLGRAQAFGLSDEPLVSGWSAALAVHAAAALPAVVWIMGSALSRADADLEDFARTRSPKRQAIWLTTLRRCRPAAVAAGLVVLILTAGDMTVTDLVQERTFAEEAYLQAQMGDGLAAAARTALPITAFVSLAVILWTIADARRFRRTSGFRGQVRRPTDWYQSHSGNLAGLAVLCATASIWAVPAAALLWRAGRSGGMAATQSLPVWSFMALAHNLRGAWPDLTETLPNTVAVAAVAAFLGTAIAWCAVSFAVLSRPFRAWLLFGAALGLATPGPVAGMAVIWFWMPIRSLYDSPFVVVAALLYRFLGIAVFLIWAASRSVPDELREAARMDGLSGFRRFRILEWPLTAPAAAAAFVVLFALSAGELPATNMTTPPGLELLSVRLWALMHTGLESHLAAFVILTTLALAALIASAAVLAVGLLRRAGLASTMIE
jgi:iron(III) transport system permease protein